MYNQQFPADESKNYAKNERASEKNICFDCASSKLGLVHCWNRTKPKLFPFEWEVPKDYFMIVLKLASRPNTAQTN